VVTHTSVVVATVMSRATCDGIVDPFRAAIANPSATTKELIMAAISLHALTRHQNQRRS
jgi:hypothetical protein